MIISSRAVLTRQPDATTTKSTRPNANWYTCGLKATNSIGKVPESTSLLAIAFIVRWVVVPAGTWLMNWKVGSTEMPGVKLLTWNW